MDPSLLFWLLGGAIGIIAYFLKGTFDKLETVEIRYNTLHEAYVKKDDFTLFRSELFARLDKIDSQQNQLSALREHELWEKLNALEGRLNK